MLKLYISIFAALLVMIVAGLTRSPVLLLHAGLALVVLITYRTLALNRLPLRSAVIVIVRALVESLFLLWITAMLTLRFFITEDRLRAFMIIAIFGAVGIVFFILRTKQLIARRSRANYDTRVR